MHREYGVVVVRDAILQVALHVHLALVQHLEETRKVSSGGGSWLQSEEQRRSIVQVNGVDRRCRATAGDQRHRCFPTMGGGSFNEGKMTGGLTMMNSNKRKDRRGTSQWIGRYILASLG